jgi:hypothetical protein
MEIIYTPLHVLALLYVAWNIVHADKLGLAWMRGKIATIDKKTITKYHHGTWLGIVLMLLTGSAIFSTVMDKIVYPQFAMKMGFVLVIVLNSFIIGQLIKIPTTKTFASLTTKEKIPLYLSGLLSFASWGGAIIAAMFILAE